MGFLFSITVLKKSYTWPRTPILSAEDLLGADKYTYRINFSSEYRSQDYWFSYLIEELYENISEEMRREGQKPPVGRVNQNHNIRLKLEHIDFLQKRILAHEKDVDEKDDEGAFMLKLDPELLVILEFVSILIQEGMDVYLGYLR
jgi:hypothetical protein